MSSSILIPGLTPDDKNPGFYPSLKYGVGKRSVGDLPVYCILLGAMREAITASIGSVTQSGAGPVITPTGTPTVSKEVVLKVTLGGTLTTATLSYSLDDGATFTPGITSAASVALPGTGVTLGMAAGTYVLNDTYSFTITAAQSFGTASPNVLYDIFDRETSDALFDPGSELGGMCSSALGVDGVNLKAMAVAQNGSAVKATATVTIGGSWDKDGEFTTRLNGKSYRCTVLADDSLSTVAARLQDLVNDDVRAPATVDADGAAAGFEWKCGGPRGNFGILFVDTTGAPPGFTATISAGSTVTGGGAFFTGGTGSDDVTDALEALLPETAPLYNFYGIAQSDAVNAGLILDQMDVKMGPLVAEYEQACFAVNTAYTNSIALAQTTLNAPISEVILDEEGETHPSQLAAVLAAVRATTEGENPNPNYTDRELPGIAPRAKEAKAIEANHAKRKALLNAGVTPTKTLNGKKVIVRAITTKCLNGATPDYSTLNVGEATVPQRMSREIGSAWSAWRAANPYVGPNPDIEGGERAAPAGTGTPDLWRGEVEPLLREGARRNWIYKVDENLPTAEWDDEAERIMSAVPLDVRPLNLQLGVEISQRA